MFLSFFFVDMLWFYHLYWINWIFKKKRKKNSNTSTFLWCNIWFWWNKVDTHTIEWLIHVHTTNRPNVNLFFCLFILNRIQFNRTWIHDTICYWWTKRFCINLSMHTQTYSLSLSHSHTQHKSACSNEITIDWIIGQNTIHFRIDYTITNMYCAVFGFCLSISESDF